MSAREGAIKRAVWEVVDRWRQVRDDDLYGQLDATALRAVDCFMGKAAVTSMVQRIVERLRARGEEAAATWLAKWMAVADQVVGAAWARVSGTGHRPGGISDQARAVAVAVSPERRADQARQRRAYASAEAARRARERSRARMGAA